MGFISELIGYPLGWIMYLFYNLVSNYGIAIILFTIVTKLILVPFSIKQQKNTVRMQQFAPMQERIRKKYGDNKEKYQEELMKLYEKENINPTNGCLPMILQFVILYGIIDVVYRPLSHIYRMASGVLTEAATIAQGYIESLGRSWNEYQRELFIIEAAREQPELFSSMPELVENCRGFENSFLGLDLGAIPSWGSILVLIPILSGLVSLGSMIYSQWHTKKMNPDAPSMGSMNIILYMMPIFSVWIAFTLPAGVGFYWIISGVVSFIQMLVLNKIMTPEYVNRLVEKDKEKAKKRPSVYQRMLEQQRAATAPGAAEPITEADKLSRNQRKELERQILNDARRRQAEKYGDEYKED